MPRLTERFFAMCSSSDGTLRRPVRFPSGGFDANFVAISDLNGDGRPDLIVTDVFSNDVGVLLNASGETP